LSKVRDPGMFCPLRHSRRVKSWLLLLGADRKSCGLRGKAALGPGADMPRFRYLERGMATRDAVASTITAVPYIYAAKGNPVMGASSPVRMAGKLKDR
jgi:hypothetical protein